MSDEKAAEVPNSDQKPEDVGPRTPAPGVVPTAPTSVDEGGQAIADQRDAAAEQAKVAEVASEPHQGPAEVPEASDKPEAAVAPNKNRRPS